MIRFFKQLVYGIFYLAVWGLVGWGIYSWTLKPAPTCSDNIQNQGEAGVDCGGPCEPCDVKRIMPLTSSQPVIFRNNNLISFLAAVSNPNQNFGSSQFGYTVNFYDGPNLLQSYRGISFIYPGETKNLIGAGIAVSSGIPSRAELQIDSISNWLPPVQFQAPKLELSSVQSNLANGQITVSGTIKNPNNFAVSQVNIGGILISRTGSQLGVSKTSLVDLAPFQEAPFQIFFLADPAWQNNLDLNSTKVFYEVKQ